MLVGKSVPELILVRTMVVFFQYLGFLCFIYFWFIFAIAGVSGIAHPVSIIIEVIGLIEIVFYFAFYLPFRSRLQKPGFEVEPLSQAERRQFFQKGLDHAPDVEQYIRKWHCNAQLGDIRRENVKDWLMWALFDKQGNPGEHDAELEEYIADAEERAGVTIKKGYGDSTPMRLSFDPIDIRHRSLLFYFVSSSPFSDEELAHETKSDSRRPRPLCDRCPSDQRVQVLPTTAQDFLLRLPSATYDPPGTE